MPPGRRTVAPRHPMARYVLAAILALAAASATILIPGVLA
jgi:hypothetical protein